MTDDSRGYSGVEFAEVLGAALLGNVDDDPPPIVQVSLDGAVREVVAARYLPTLNVVELVLTENGRTASRTAQDMWEMQLRYLHATLGRIPTRRPPTTG